MKLRKSFLLLVSVLCLLPVRGWAPAESAGQSPRISSPGRYSGYGGPIYDKGAVTRSVYVTMSDGVKIAVDYSLPRGLPSGVKIPAVLTQTRYWRAQAMARGIDRTASFLVSHGYAHVSIDVRGTGASFGTWPLPWSEREIKDGAEIVDWIISRPWSNGVVGAYGTSYMGVSAELLLANNHPAVRAVVPRFAHYDSYRDATYPGGILLEWFARTWEGMNQALDRNDLQAVARMTGMKIPLASIMPGVRPAGPPLLKWIMLENAVREHRDNGDVYQQSMATRFRDDYSHEWEGVIDQISPFYHRARVEASNAAVYSYTGWWDGCFLGGGISRHLTLSNPGKLIIGPWPHGGHENISPFAPTRENQFDHDAELLRFFDYHLKGIDNGIMDEPPVYYYTMGEEKWKSASSWPPPSITATWYFSAGRSLSRSAPSGAGDFDDYRVDYSAGSGTSSRYDSLVNLFGAPIGYPDRAEADRKLMIYETGPLTEDLEVTGHPVVRLYVSSSAEDGQFFAYLEDVSPGGTVSYITEGMLRASCRKVSHEKPPYRLPPNVPYHTFKRNDAEPMAPGRPVLVTFELQPTSVLFMKGHRIRVAIGGADKDHFEIPEGPEPEIRLHRSKALPSSIDLPMVPR